MAGENPAEKSRNMVVLSAAAGYVYSDVSSTQTQTQTHLMNQIQSFEPNAEMFNLTTAGMEMIGFPQKNLNLQQPSDANSVIWKGFFGKHGNQSGPSSSKSTLVVNQSTTTADFYQHEFNKSDFATGISQTTSTSENLMVAPESAAWQEQGEEEEEEEEEENRLMVDDPSSSSSLRCVFPCEGNERPSQGLSLSLSSANPSSIGLQSFELRHTTHPHHQGHQQDDHHMRFLSPNSNSRDGFFGKFAAGAAAIPIQEQQMMMQQQQQEEDGFVGKAVNLNHHHQGNFQLRNSKYLAPAQQLLKEFCNLGTQKIHPPKQKPASNHWDWELPDETGTTTSSCSRKSSSLYSLELAELQKRKSKLLSMLEEVDKRYKHYCDQMKAVVSSFESVAGNGAARVYSALASKAMSRHFRCLRDGIVGQIHGTKKAMGEKDPVAPGTTRGETPRLRLLDQALRQQRVFQQMSIMESHPWRPQRGLPERSVSVLRAWLFEHFLHPYPSDVDKHILARQTGLSRSQVSNWFINARVRLWKPMVEEMYLEETKEQDSPDSPANPEEDGRTNHNIPHQPRMEDQKPTAEQLVRIDSECLSSIINNNHHPEKNDPKNGKSLQNHHNHNFGRVAEAFGAMELDFSSHNHHTAGAVSFSNDGSGHQNFGGSGGGVSLTLGLQQHGHGGSGVSLAFSPSSQSSLFYTRDPIEDCQPVQYSLLDGDQGHNLPYRNLMGAQLLHDLAG